MSYKIKCGLHDDTEKTKIRVSAQSALNYLRNTASSRLSFKCFSQKPYTAAFRTNHSAEGAGVSAAGAGVSVAGASVAGASD